jgi:pSer/pThr/pTyr-binding forkhead associated (FHA) protein
MTKLETKPNDLVNDSAVSEDAQLLQLLEQQNQRIQDLMQQLETLNANSSAAIDPVIEAEFDAADNSGATGVNPYVNRLLVIMNGNENMKRPLNDNIMTIGRDAKNDIQIRSRFISRYHARIISDANGAVVEDLDSRNGVNVNSLKVRRQALRSGDLIDLGKIQVKYIDLMEGSAGEGSA